VAVAAVAETIVGRGGGEAPAATPESRVGGPDVPASGALAGSLLLATSPDCRRLELDLATLLLVERAGRSECKQAPAGRAGSGLVVADRPGERGVYENGRVLLSEARLRSALEHAPSGHVHPLGADRRADGLLAVTVSAAPRDIYDVLEDAGIDPTNVDDLDQASELLGLNGPYGAFALSASGTLPRTELQLWRDGKLETTHPLRAAAYPFANRRFGELIEFSPDGSELLLGHVGPGSPALLLDVATLRTTMRPIVQYGFAWSPDGEFFALSTGTEIWISGALRSQASYVLPISAVVVGWRGDQSPPS
jgi:hypothetical protein